jgi:predicted nucleotidyltransferase
MLPNQDFKDLLSELNAHGVEFLVIGAHALAAHGHVRATKDLDVWVRPEPENATRVVAALEAFGAPMHALTEADFASPGITFQIGVEPVRIDVITAIDGITFDPAWQNRVPADYGGEPVFVISREDFIVNKLAAGRPQDLADVASLERRT